MHATVTLSAKELLRRAASPTDTATASNSEDGVFDAVPLVEGKLCKRCSPEQILSEDKSVKQACCPPRQTVTLKFAGTATRTTTVTATLVLPESAIEAESTDNMRLKARGASKVCIFSPTNP